MKQFRAISIALIVCLLLTACAPILTAQPADSPIIVTDGLNRQVTLPAAAQKIVSLAPSNTEILYAIGAGSQIIGRDDFSNFPSQALELPSVGGSMSNYNLEEITRLEPDLVLAGGINTPEQVKALEDLGITVFFLANPVDLEDLFENLQTVALLTGQESEAEALVASLRQRVNAVESALEGVTERPSVFYELDGSDPARPWTAGPGSFTDYLITLAGGENIAAGLSGEWAQISQEELILQDPHIILLGDAAYGVTVEQVAARPGWDTLQAVRQQRVYPFDDDLVSRPGPRLVDGLVALARIFHPDLAGDLE